MKTLTIWEPWATAIAMHAKRIETRGWSTNYRGPLAIHAAKRHLPKHEILDFEEDPAWRTALAITSRAAFLRSLSFGCVVAIADLVDCRRTESFSPDEIDASRRRPQMGWSWTERDMGDFYPGRYGWVLENARPLAEPIPATGKQGIWEWDAPVELAFCESEEVLTV